MNNLLEKTVIKRKKNIKMEKIGTGSRNLIEENQKKIGKKMTVIQTLKMRLSEKVRKLKPTIMKTLTLEYLPLKMKIKEIKKNLINEIKSTPHRNRISSQ
jgi:hypothetical protein